MGNLSTTNYIEGAVGIAAIYYATKKSGAEKYALLALGAYLLYTTYTAYSGAPTAA